MMSRELAARWSRNTLFVTLAMLLFVGGFVLGTQYGHVGADPGSQSDRDQLFAPFWETWDLLHTSYVEPVDDVSLMEAALSGMVDSLGDDHSFYMDPETYAIVNTDLEGEFEGIGATVQQDEDSGALIIISTLPGSPAERAGILSGDAVVQVDGVDITGMTQTEIISRIRGQAGTEVELGILREGEPEMLIMPVTRAHIQIDSVRGEVLDGDLVYIQLFQFGSQTAEDLRALLHDLDVEHRAGLILDMRRNPGGFLSTAVDVASEFITDGVILTERFRSDERVYEANGDPSAPTVPMVVLIDEGSASGAELVAGALQDLERAVIVGTTTFGKGSVQTSRQLSNGGGVRLTIARWYTPNDRSIQGEGLTPDIEVQQDDATTEDEQLLAAIEVLQAAAVVQPAP